MSYLDDIPFTETPFVIDKARPGDIIWQYTGPLKNTRMMFMLMYLDYEERVIRVVKVQDMEEERLALLNQFVKLNYDMLSSKTSYHKVRNAFYEFSSRKLSGLSFMRGGFNHAETRMYYHTNELRAGPSNGIPNKRFTTALNHFKDI